MEHLGVIIRRKRKEVGLKIYELAKEVGVTPVYITKIEKHGQLSSPHVMRRISSILRDKRLFDLYLKMKYPMVSGKVNKWQIGSGFKKINDKRDIRKNRKEDKLMHKLIVKKCTVACALSNFSCAHYFEHNFLSMFITPKHLNLFAGGMPSGDFVNNPDEGYRTLVPDKTTQPPKIPTRQDR